MRVNSVENKVIYRNSFPVIFEGKFTELKLPLKTIRSSKKLNLTVKP